MDTSPDYTLWIILVCFGLFVVAWELNEIARQLSRMNDREDEAEQDRREREEEVRELRGLAEEGDDYEGDDDEGIDWFADQDKKEGK